MTCQVLHFVFVEPFHTNSEFKIHFSLTPEIALLRFILSLILILLKSLKAKNKNKSIKGREFKVTTMFLSICKICRCQRFADKIFPFVQKSAYFKSDTFLTKYIKTII